jgi:glucosylceramidase
MVMSFLDQANFVKNNLGPLFRKQNIQTKIIVWDHNCDNPDYPINVLNDNEANPYIDGSAFHLYAGDISALSKVHLLHPNKNLYFTEQWTSSKGSFAGDLQWHVKNVVIGSVKNWSKVALEWNLANDANFQPHTPGGCTECKGALTISGASITRNVSYYIIAHASKFVPTGSKRIESNSNSNLPNVAFMTPTGKKVIIIENDKNTSMDINVKQADKMATVSLPAGAVATIIW